MAGTPNGPQNANAEAVSGAPGPGTPRPAVSATVDTLRAQMATVAARQGAGGVLEQRRQLAAMAEAWRAAGCLVHPVKADGSKVALPVAGGGIDVEAATYPATYQSGQRAGQPHPLAGKPNPKAGQHRYGWKRVATGELAYPWASVRADLRGVSDGICVFTGKASGALEMVELEGRAAHLLPQLEAAADARGIRELWERVNAGCSEITPSGGIHWFYRCTDAPALGNVKLALRMGADKPECFAETRGEGGLVVVAGSFGRTHKSGLPYAIRTGAPATIAAITAAEREAIHDLFRTLDELPHVTGPAAATPVVRRERPAGELLPGDDFNERGTWAEALPAGWVRIGTSPRCDAWTGGGQGGRKTADLYHNDDTLYIYDTDYPGAGRKLDRFAAFAWLNHNGDFHAAAVELYARGYGARTATPSCAPDAAPAELPPPVRTEQFTTPAVVPVDVLRASVEEQLRWAVTHRPALAVVTAGTAASKTTAAVRVGAELPGRVVWNVQSHAAAAQVVAMHREIGCTDVAAMPPRDASTCRCWTDADAREMAAAHPGGRPIMAMERALRVGAPMLACRHCPLLPSKLQAAAVAAEAGRDELAFLQGSGWDVQTAADVEPAACPYWARRAEAEAARVLVQCQARTEREPPKPDGWEQLTLFTDESVLAVVQPRRCILPEHVAAVRDVLTTAAANAHNRLQRMRFGKQREDEYQATRWAEAVASVADAILDRCATLVAEGRHVVGPLAMPAVDPEVVPRAPRMKLAGMLAREQLPAAFTQDALELVRAAAMGTGGGTVMVAADAGGVWHASVHHSWQLELDPRVCHVGLDATVDVPGLLNVRPDAVVLTPPGAAPRVHHAEQWWQEIRPGTHPRVVVEQIERALDAKGWKSAVLMMPKRHRTALFPVTRPRGGRPAEDKPADVDVIAAWNDGTRKLSEATAAARRQAAVELAARVEAIRARLARDAEGRVLVEHHRGTRARGSNAFMAAAGVDGVLVIGCTRTSPTDVAGHMLATGRTEAVQAGPGTWGWVEGDLPHVDGTTRTVRWRGYGCPAWAEAARALNRADLEQTAARGRPNLAGGVPVVVVAAEPCGLPLADPPAVMPPGVAAVVEAVARCQAEARPRGTTAGTVQIAQISTPTPQRIRPTVYRAHGSLCLLDAWPDSPPVPAAAVVQAVDAPERTVRRWLADAVELGLVVRTGAARAVCYAVATNVQAPPPPAPASMPAAATTAVLEHPPAPPPPAPPPPPAAAPPPRAAPAVVWPLPAGPTGPTGPALPVHVPPTWPPRVELRPDAPWHDAPPGGERGPPQLVPTGPAP